MKKTVIIVAGGKGERMQSTLPKQFIELNGLPILMHTIAAFAAYDPAMDCIVVLPAGQMAHWQQLCTLHRFALPHLTVAGGPTRFHSVRNGLQAVRLPSLVAVHDGVRPLVDRDTIGRCFDCARQQGAAIPATPLTDSIRMLRGDSSQACDRSLFRLVQTPQVFDGDLLSRAYEQDYSPAFTDDASVVEACGHPVALVEGSTRNIKITAPMDLKLAEMLMQQ